MKGQEKDIQGSDIQKVGKERDDNCTDQPGWMLGHCHSSLIKLPGIFLCPFLFQKWRTPKTGCQPVGGALKKIKYLVEPGGSPNPKHQNDAQSSRHQQQDDGCQDFIDGQVMSREEMDEPGMRIKANAEKSAMSWRRTPVAVRVAGLPRRAKSCAKSAVPPAIPAGTTRFTNRAPSVTGIKSRVRVWISTVSKAAW